MAVISLRERKKHRTRQVLMETARRLFVEQSYEATTLEQIAGEAEFSVATLVRYFDTKAGLLLDPWYKSLEYLRTLMRDPDRADTVSVYRFFMETEVDRYRKDAAAVGQPVGQLICEVGELLAKRLAIQQEMEDLLSEGFSRDADTDPASDFYSQIYAATILSTSHAAYRRWVAGGGKGDVGEICLRVMDFVFENFPDRQNWDAADHPTQQAPLRANQ